MSPEHSTDELARLGEWAASGLKTALATVVSTWGSSPRPVGSHLVINEKGEFLGSVSGGCIEGAVVAEALEIMVEGDPRVLEFGVSDEEAWEVGLSCGGAIRIYVEPVE
jgi:xanthine/CO dehydrogenase XdhC/CoxF family maturation factor